MAVDKVFASQYYGEHLSTSTEDGIDFGFNASKVVVQNDKATAVFVRFNSTTPSTGGIRTCSGEELVFEHSLTRGFSLASQSTTTGTIARVWATGG